MELKDCVVGAFVRARGLQGATALNGRMGNVDGLERQSGRVRVCFGPPEGVKSLRPGNLLPVDGRHHSSKLCKALHEVAGAENHPGIDPLHFCLEQARARVRAAITGTASYLWGERRYNGDRGPRDAARGPPSNRSPRAPAGLDSLWGGPAPHPRWRKDIISTENRQVGEGESCTETRNLGGDPRGVEVCNGCGACGPRYHLRQCVGCKQRRFCSDECQRAAWASGHREECARLKQQREAGTGTGRTA